MFMIPGSTNVVRVNGRAKVTADAGLRARFERQGKRPRTVIVIEVAEVYFQCARALLRARLWTAGDESAGLPTAGQLLAAMTAGTVGGAEYDAAWAERAAATMW
jgi:predicted pyridoxine 5'-phosphate oxidase superfamily flavin-nucleotide-binding protein